MALNFDLVSFATVPAIPGSTLDPGEKLLITITTNQNFTMNVVGGEPRVLLSNGEYAEFQGHSGNTMTFIYEPTTTSPQVAELTLGGPQGQNAYVANGSLLKPPGNQTAVSAPNGINAINGANPPSFSGVTCFMPGTLIATPVGDQPVETLAMGDEVLTVSGRAASVRWVSRQTVSLRFSDPYRVVPIRIRAGALGEGLPHRDLLVSPSHAILVDGVLANAGALVNGTSILRDTAVPQVFTYFHVELAEHDLLLAEGVPAETFVDNVSRNTFDNGAEHTALYGDVTIPEMDLPRATAHRQIPAATRQRLAAIAAAMDDGTAAAA